MLKNDSISSLFQSIVSALSIGVIYFLIIKYLGNESLGIYSLVVGFFSFFSIFGTGVSGTLLRYLPPLDKLIESILVSNLLNTALILNGLIGLLLLFLFILFRIEIVHFYFIDLSKSIDFSTFFNLSLITFFINIFNTTFLFYFDGIQLINVRNKIVIVSSIVLLVIFLGLLNFDFGLISIFYALLAQSISQLFSYVYKVLSLGHKFNFKIQSISKFFNYGNKFQLLNLIIAFQEFVIRHLISRYFNLGSVGIYEVLSKIFIQIKSLITLMVYPVLPKITRSFYNGDEKAELGIHFSKMKDFIFIFGTFIFSSFFSSGALFLLWFYKNDIKTLNDSLIIFSTISLANFIGLLTVPVYYFIQGIGNIKNLIFYHSICTLISIFFYYSFSEEIEIKYFNIPFLFAMIICSIYLLYTFNKLASPPLILSKNFNFLFILVNFLLQGSFLFFDILDFYNYYLMFLISTILLLINIYSFFKFKLFLFSTYFNE
jgi:O-antigen/teichoic acid export membrane protein